MMVNLKSLKMPRLDPLREASPRFAESATPDPSHCWEVQVNVACWGRPQRLDWVDYFIGQAESEPRYRHSLLDPAAKVGIHYLLQDLPRIRQQPCPPEVPPHLWKRLQRSLAPSHL